MIGVIFWSGTGNTERMAYEVAEGIKAAGQDVEVKSVSEVSVDEAAAYDKLALGCADMGAEQLEEGEFEPFYTELEGKLSGKKVAIFGSYGWGGTWLEDWGTRIKDAGGELVADGVAILGEPDDDGNAQCQELGLTVRPTGRAGAKAGTSDPAMARGCVVAQRIKGTPGASLIPEGYNRPKLAMAMRFIPIFVMTIPLWVVTAELQTQPVKTSTEWRTIYTNDIDAQVSLHIATGDFFRTSYDIRAGQDLGDSYDQFERGHGSVTIVAAKNGTTVRKDAALPLENITVNGQLSGYAKIEKIEYRGVTKQYKHITKTSYEPAVEVTANGWLMTTLVYG